MPILDKFDNTLLNNVVGVSYAGKPKDNTMMYITKKVEHLLLNLQGTKGAVVFLEQGIVVPEDMVDKNSYVMCADPVAQYTKVVLELDKQRNEKLRKLKYTLTLGGYWLGENVEIGDGTYVEPGVLIDHGVKIGKNCVIKSGAKIRFDTVIGDNCSIGENTVIGEPGFNVSEIAEGVTDIIPNFGKVHIGNWVYIGANTSVSKGAAGDTEICDFVKIDSNCRIGHDVYFEKYVEVRAGSVISGFVEMGQSSVSGAGATVRNRVIIGSNSMIGAGSYLSRNLKDNLTVVGNPAITMDKFGQREMLLVELKQFLKDSKWE